MNEPLDNYFDYDPWDKPSTGCTRRLLPFLFMALAIVFCAFLALGATRQWFPLTSHLQPFEEQEPDSSIIATLPHTVQVSEETLHPPNLAALQALMLDAINRNRAEQGLPPVKWDKTASLAGQLHVEDMLKNDYFSHWNLDGYGPEHRYVLLGGNDAVAENIYTFFYRFDTGKAAPIEDWEQVVLQAQANLMNSPGHRANILDPIHTHVGIGIAYDSQKGEMRLAQEFLNRYVNLTSLPQRGRVGEIYTVAGTLLGEAQEPLINLTHQPFPPRNSRANLQDGPYQSEAEIFQAITPDVRQDRFSSNVTLDYKGRPGIYGIRIWVRLRGEMILAAEAFLWAES